MHSISGNIHGSPSSIDDYKSFAGLVYQLEHAGKDKLWMPTHLDSDIDVMVQHKGGSGLWLRHDKKVI
jgi:hypothetical protein